MTVLTEAGPVEVSVPRDRDGSSESLRARETIVHGFIPRANAPAEVLNLATEHPIPLV